MDTNKGISFMFQSRLFRRLFSTYILVIFSGLILYSSFIVYENHRINTIQIERKSEIQLDEVESMLEQRFLSAQNIVQNLRYSTVMRQLYLSAKMGVPLDSFVLVSIQNELRNTMALGGLSVFKTVVFIDGSTKAYSSSGIIILGEPYNSVNQEYPYIYEGTVKDGLGLDASKRYSFNQDFLLYCDGFTYQSGQNAGTICILFDLKNLQNSIKEVVQDGFQAEIVYEGKNLLQQGEELEKPEGTLYERNSTKVPGVTYKIYASKHIPVEKNFVFVIFILIIFMASIFFVWLAYWESKRYYMPIDHLEQMISGEEKNPDHDEMEKIIFGIQKLIGEKNGYREKMLTIAPYARTGMLHTMITGNMEEENVQVFSEENYLDLIKPYFIVSIVNFAYDDSQKGHTFHHSGKNASVGETEIVMNIADEKHVQQIRDLFQNVVDTFSTEEQHIVYYFKDVYDVFLIVNFDEEHKDHDLFMKIHDFVRSAMEKEHCYVTMGIDEQRENISELKTACNSAMKSLDGILCNGRGKVFFADEEKRQITEYYFPVNCKEKLKRCLQKQNKNDVHTILFDIYKKNLDLNGTPEMYRALLDEFHLTLIKTVKEITELDGIHVSIEKYQDLATLQEIFDYYDAAMLSIIDALHEQDVQKEADSRLEDDIVSYIEANYCDENLSMQSIMDRFHITNKYFSVFFKNRFGTTYLQYIQNKRIQKAQELLKENRYTLAEIGTMCGYTNPLTFRRNFKSITGVNPSDYQQK